jgi:hypothetical protein
MGIVKIVGNFRTEIDLGTGAAWRRLGQNFAKTLPNLGF